jgi:hypothetical protein
MKLNILFLLYFFSPITIITFGLSGLSLTLSVASSIVLTIFIFLIFMLSGGSFIKKMNIYSKVIALYYFVYLFMLCISFLYITIFIRDQISISYFITNFIMNMVFIFAFFTVIISSSFNPEASLKTCLNGFFAVAALSSIFGIFCVFSLIFFSFDLENFLGQYFSIGSEYEAKREYSIAGIFRGPGLSGTNNSSIFYSSIIPSLFYFSFMHSNGPSKKYKFYLLLIIFGSLVTMSRIGVFLSISGLIMMYIIKNGVTRLVLLLLLLFLIFSIAAPQWIYSDFWLELIEARLNADSNRFLLYQGAFLLLQEYPFGVGLGQYYPLAQAFLPANLFDLNIHSSWLNSYLSLGPIYFICLLFSLILSFTRLWSGDYFQKSLAVGLANLMIAGIVNQVFENVYFHLYFALCFLAITFLKPKIEKV